MVVYHGTTSYHLLEFWIHKLIFHRQEDAILLFPEWILNTYPEFERKIPQRVFKEIVYWTHPNLSELTFDKWISEGIGRELPLGVIRNADEIYVAGAQYYFSQWLIKESVSFNFFEESAGRLTKSNVVEENVKKLDCFQYTVASESGMFTGENSLVKRKYCNADAQVQPFNDSKAVDFNLISLLGNLTIEDAQGIFDFYDAPKQIKLSYPSAFLLTQHFANLKTMRLEQQSVMYQMTVDYFMANYHLVIKTHPSDLLYYEKLICDCEVIKQRFPSEFLPFLATENADLIATIDSTGIAALRAEFHKVLEFNTEYEKGFINNHRYYLATVLSVCMGADVIEIGTNQCQMQNMLEFGDAKEKFSCIKELKEMSGKLYIVDRVDARGCSRYIERISDNDVIVFLNTDNKYAFYSSFEHNIFENIVSKRICLEAIDREKCDIVSTEYIWIYCKTERMRQLIMKISYEKELLNSGIKVKVPEDLDKDIQIAALRGMLEATEKRLKFCLQERKRDSDERIYTVGRG